MNNEELWRSILAELELSLSRANFTTWFKHSFVAEQGEGKIVVGVPNAFTKTWLENKYHHAIVKALRAITHDQVKEVHYRVQTQRTAPPPTDTPFAGTPPSRDDAKSPLTAGGPSEKSVATDRHGLNPRYLFSTFIVGKNSELAHAAARAVVDRPGNVYNPLFIYGGVGLGKTHLLQAVGHEYLTKDPSAKILYTSCEQFTNEFVRAIKNGSIDQFKDKHRTTDLLLIDDIQFMTGKEQTEEQFFHTFNELHQRNKQIVISSDRPPKALPGLEHRLLSRFEWGMIADIGIPDLETRTAILEAKMGEKRYHIPKEIISAIAAMVESNIRELEGALNRVIAYHQLSGTPPTPQSVQNILDSITGAVRKGSITPKHLMKTVSDYYDVAIEDLTGESRKKELVIPRQIIMFLMREEIKSSFPNIGAELGGRDHTTAMHAYTKISKEIEKNERIRQDINLIKQRLYHHPS